jgi:predicted PhzF superfamily epimerase YddE/YHI9
MFLKLELPHKGVIVTAKSALPDVHFISRAFLPRIGVDEGATRPLLLSILSVLLTYLQDADPVTDSAHCLLAPYWIKQLGLEKGTVLSARQVSERGGEIDIVYDEDKKTCKLRGKAQTIAHGDMYLN